MDILQTAWRKCAKECTVRSAMVACIWTSTSGRIRITVNKRGGGRITGWTHHAEELMYERMKRELWDRGGTVLVLRFRKDGSLGCARPCIMCDKRLRKSGVDHVVYSNAKGEMERLW